jgi:hypothetical protein
MSYEDFQARISARDAPDRLEKMKPILDRIPEHWGKWLPEVGWDDLLLELDTKLAEIDPNYEIQQAKQKFGELRFYASLSDGFYDTDPTDAAQYEFSRLIVWAESKSTVTCEHCGGPAERRPGSWIAVLCDEHAS